jgi:hypothetical protein
MKQAGIEDELREANALIDKLQRALSFWLPPVAADDAEIADRAGFGPGVVGPLADAQRELRHALDTASDRT